MDCSALGPNRCSWFLLAGGPFPGRGEGRVGRGHLYWMPHALPRALNSEMLRRQEVHQAGRVVAGRWEMNGVGSVPSLLLTPDTRSM